MVKAVFLDRDGTLNEEVNYLHRPEDLRMLPGTAEALRMLRGAGFRLIIVTNQAGVGRGYYTEEELMSFQRYFDRVLERDGVSIDGFYYCPHHPEHGIGAYRKVCRCRKPGTGMLEQAEKDLGGIDRARSWMIGDKESDTLAGKRFGLRAVLVGTGYGSGIRREQAEKGGILPDGKPADGSYDYYAEDLPAAAALICGEDAAAKSAVPGERGGGSVL